LKKNILVLGDSIVDHDLFCDCIGLSLETPTLKTRLVDEKVSFGGAANVVNNLLSLGARVTFFTNVGEDQYSGLFYGWKSDNFILKPLAHRGENLVKSRVWIKKGLHSYKYLQINRGDKRNLVIADLELIKKYVAQQKVDTVVLADYRNGLFDDKKTTQDLIEYFKTNKAVVISSSQISDGKNQYPHFANSDFICMNHEEAIQNCPFFKPTYKHMQKLSKNLNSNICVTLGAAGSILYYNNVLLCHDGYRVAPVDTCGAGDSFLAAFSMSYKDKDLSFCNKWAAASTLKRGTVSPVYEDLNEID